jgi:hypothetical protein
VLRQILRCWLPLRVCPSSTPIRYRTTLPPSSHLPPFRLSRIISGICRRVQSRTRMVSMAFVYLAESFVLVRINRGYLLQLLPRLNERSSPLPACLCLQQYHFLHISSQLRSCSMSHLIYLSYIRGPTDTTCLQLLGHGRRSALAHLPPRLLPLLQVTMEASSSLWVPHLASSSREET